MQRSIHKTLKIQALVKQSYSYPVTTHHVRIILLASLIVILTACNNDVDMNTTGEAIPVVHCLIDPSDSVHYCRLGRTYKSDDEGATISPPKDSLMLIWKSYGYVEIFRKGLSESEFIYFEPALDIGRETGFFPEHGNLVMKINYCFQPADRCVLYLFLPDKERITSAETTIVGQIEILDPTPIPSRELTLTPEQGYLIRWITAPQATIYQPIVYVNFLEADSASINPKQIRIPLQIHFFDTENSSVSQFMSGLHFYKELGSQISEKTGIKREIISLDFEIAFGSEELALAVAEAIYGKNDFGNIKDFTNFDMAKGVFASRSTKKVKNIRLSYITKDSLATSVYTKHLGFIPSGERL
ncbi:MAG: DUF4249 family protein [Bacteroidales bacterium]|nr:DUF4249 family protein [Bacteroidales bacterium]